MAKISKHYIDGEWKDCVGAERCKYQSSGNELRHAEGDSPQELMESMEASDRETASDEGYSDFGTLESSPVASAPRTPDDIRSDIERAQRETSARLKEWEEADEPIRPTAFNPGGKALYASFSNASADQSRLENELSKSQEFYQEESRDKKDILEDIRAEESMISIIEEDYSEGIIGFGKLNSDKEKPEQKLAALRSEYRELKKKENREETSALVPRNQSGNFGRYDNSGDYYAATDKKHFKGGDGTGSAFTAKNISSLDDLVDTARSQRGSLEGDDRDKLIAQGANPDSFLPSDKARYLMVEAPGENSKIGINEIDAGDNEEIFTAEKSKSGNISLSVEKGRFKKESYGTLIIGKEDDGSETVWTAHPGAPAKSSGRGTFNDFNEGQRVSRNQIREMAGTDEVQVSIRKPSKSSFALNRMKSSRREPATLPALV